MPSFFTINTVMELGCLAVATVCLYRERNSYWKSFIYYLLSVCVVEFVGIYLRKVHLPNHNWYTACLWIECLMLSSFFYHLFSKYKIKLSLLYSWLGIFMVVYLAEIWYNKLDNFTFRTAAFMSVVFVIASLCFYVLILRDEVFRKLSTYPPFWIVNGCLFFYFGSTACNLFFDYLIHDHYSTLSLSIRYLTFNILNILLYSCWSYAFICRFLQRNSSSSLR